MRLRPAPYDYDYDYDCLSLRLNVMVCLGLPRVEIGGSTLFLPLGSMEITH